jgi:peptidoglycan L-alanyl-D-glutamate endopeptidase CwlK
LHPKVREEVMKIYVEKIAPALTGGVYCRFTHTLRTFEEQEELYKIGRTKLVDAEGRRLGIVTKARGGQSYHQYALALDFCIMESRTATWDVTKDMDKDGKPDWFEVISIFKENGWESGADWKFKDFPTSKKH